MLTNVLLALVLSAAIALATGPKLIEWLRGHQMKTSENELGPKEHLKKRGTPIMGGLMIALGCIVSFVLCAAYTGAWVTTILPLLLVSLGSMAVGLADDWTKAVKHRSEGLTPWQKIIGLSVVCLGFSVWCYFTQGSKVLLPFANTEWDLGLWYIPLLALTVLFMTNSANLQDGLDGLLSSVTVVGMIAFGVLAVLMSRQGYTAAVLDADMTGPSIPRAFGLHEQAQGTDIGIMPVVTKTGIRVMSLNLLLEHETDPVIWRGPVIGGVVQQFWSDVLWQDVDYMFVDMPPGTGDVALNVFQSLPVDGVIIVTSPQELVSMVVEKAVKMAQMMDIPVLGLVENMSYLPCPDCGKKIYLFGEGKTDEAAQRYNLPVLAKMPLDPTLAELVDAGEIESFQGHWLDGVAEKITE